MAATRITNRLLLVSGLALFEGRNSSLKSRALHCSLSEATTHGIVRVPRAFAASRSSRAFTTQRPTDCPICQKFGSGPCGPLFWKWWDCSEAHPEDYTTVCAQEFEKFQQCSNLQETEEARSTQENQQEGSLVAWQRFLLDDLAPFPRQNFPDYLKPRLIRERNMFGEVSLVDRSSPSSSNGTTANTANNNNDESSLSLLAAIVVQCDKEGDEPGVLAGASTTEMIPNEQDRKSIAFWIPTGNSVTVSVIAVYEDKDNDVHVFEQTFAHSPQE